ncbi:hypothetical protein Tsubulata_021233 [Turnera subulata]|uniref:Late embryogenesis abundant protein LEA-2 subgroup domain-containing protein n=1 Tax=Turnera subulata TaxID=218843 RepID=A0A9Q0J9N3_9ROSI|nr:hypothetical protein Tsubulata_021233 [Turnera subulata]
MSRHPETNPHFIKQQESPRLDAPSRHEELRPLRHDDQNQPREEPATQLPSRGQGSKPKGSKSQNRDQASGQASKPQGPRRVPPQRGSYSSPWIPPVPRQDPNSESHFPLHGDPSHQEPHPESHYPLHGDQPYHSAWYDNPLHRPDQHSQAKPKVPERDNQRPKSPQHSDIQHVPLPVQQPPRRDQGHSPTQDIQPQHQDRSRPQPQGAAGIIPAEQGFFIPRPPRTKPITWLGAVFCAIFWIVIFLGGIIVLIVYLVYRPRSPRFDVSSATLNAAYVDAGNLLNADLSLLANFSNPSRKVSVDFSSVIIDLYYGSTLIATQYIEPFKAERGQSRYANIHMVTSQVRLPLLETQQLQTQVNRNGVILQVKGVFRVRSYLGSFLRYSYHLYSHCHVMVAGPPNGVLLGTKCRTKR